jgi:hypothetical protein
MPALFAPQGSRSFFNPSPQIYDLAQAQIESWPCESTRSNIYLTFCFVLLRQVYALGHKILVLNAAILLSAQAVYTGRYF